MRLTDIPFRLIEDLVRQWRNRAIAFSIVAVCAIIAAIEVLSALRVGLEPLFGPAGARLAIAGLFACVAGVTLLMLSRSERPSAEEEKEQFSREERVSLIAEAINLGYTVARDLKKPAAETPTDEPVSSEPVGAPAQGEKKER